MTPRETSDTAVLDFDIAEYLGDRPAPNASRQLLLVNNKTAKFTNTDGDSCSITPKQLKLNGLRTSKGDPDREGNDNPDITNLAFDVFFAGDVKIGDAVHPYFRLNGMSELPHHIYVQNFRCATDSAQELINYLKSAHGWRVNTNPRKLDTQQFGNLLTASPPPAPTNDAGETDFTNWGASIDEITIGSNWDESAAPEGFRDFATELTATYNKLAEIAQIEDPQAKSDARKDTSRYILAMTGGKSDGWARTAQVHNLKIAGKTFDLWSAADEVIDIRKLVANSKGETAERTPLGQTEEPF